MVSLYPHVAQNEDELNFDTGARIVVLSRAEREWWRGRNEATGQTGMFPVNYVRPITAPAGHPGQAGLSSKSCKLLLLSPGWMAVIICSFSLSPHSYVLT